MMTEELKPPDAHRIEAAARALVGDARYDALPVRASHLERKADPCAEWHDRTELHASVSGVVAAWNGCADHSPDAGKMVQTSEPPADMVERVAQDAWTITNRAVLGDREDLYTPWKSLGTTKDQYRDTASAVLALLKPQMDAAAGLMAALEEIANPLDAMRRRAEADGRKLSAMAVEIASSPGRLQGIAIDAIAAAKAAGIGEAPCIAK